MAVAACPDQSRRNSRWRSDAKVPRRSKPLRDLQEVTKQFQAESGAGNHEAAFGAFHAAFPDSRWETALPDLDDTGDGPGRSSLVAGSDDEDGVGRGVVDDRCVGEDRAACADGNDRVGLPGPRNAAVRRVAGGPPLRAGKWLVEATP